MKTNSVKNRFFRPQTLVAFLAVFGATQLAKAATIYTWNAVNGTSVNTNWNANANWLPNTANPGSTDTAIFGATGTVAASTTINNVVTVNTTITSLTFNQNGSTAFHVTQIPSGVTLTVSGAVTNGGIVATDGALTPTFMTGAGTFVANGTAFAVNNFGSTASAALATLDLSGLSNFVYNNSSGIINVGEGGTSTPNRPGGVLTLAGGSNNITASVINFQTLSGGNSGNGSSAINLGAGTNVINVGTFNIAHRKNAGNVQFKVATGGLRIRGASGNSDDTSRAAIDIADTKGKTGTSSPNGKLLLSGAGHPVDIKVSTLMISLADAGTGSAVGLMNFDAGTVDATTINMAACSGTAVGSTGTLSISNNTTAGTSGTLVVGTGGISLVNQAAGASTGNLVINGGTVISSGNITKTTSGGVGNITNNSGNITLAAGVAIGTTAIPIDTLSLSSGSLHLNIGAGSTATNIIATAVPTSGATTITIDAITAYLGGTTVNALISYNTGTDPFSNLALVLPGGYTGTLVDDTAKKTIDLQITAGPVATLPIITTWNGGSGTGSLWSDSANWNGTNIFTGDTLFFDGGARLNNTNDTTGGTTYSNITFSAGAEFVLNGSPITLAAAGGNITNSSSNPQTVNLGLNYTTSLTLDGGSAGLITGKGLTNTATTGLQTLTLAGTGSLTNLFAIAANGTNTITTASAANWTIVDNSSASAITISNAGINIAGGGTLNFGNAGSAPVLTTLVGGQGTDNGVGDGGTASTLNVVNGTLTLERRLNGQNANLNVSGGTLNVWSQLQWVNSSAANVGTVSVSGGNLNVWNSAGTSVSGTIYLASRGQGTLNLSGSGLVQCTTIDLSRAAAAGTKGTVNLDGGTLSVNLVTTASNATGPTNGAETATLNFNGGTLKVRSSSSANFFQQNGLGGVTASNVLMNLVVKAGGAVIDSNGQTITNQLVMQHDASLGGTPDGGLTKKGAGTLSLNAANTYTGNTVIQAGTLALSGSGAIASPNIVITGGATFDVSLMPATFSLGSGQTLSNSTSTAVLGGNATTASGTVSLTYASGTPSLAVTNGTLTLSAPTVFNINNTGSALAANSYKIIATNTSGLVAGPLPAVTVGGAGTASGTTNFLKLVNSELYLVVDHPPVAATMTAYRPDGLTVKVALANLATNWSDADSDAVTLVGINLTTTNGVTVTTNGSFILYTNTANVADQISYTISDSQGVTATGLINVVMSPNPFTGQTATVSVGGSTATVNFAGIPGYGYGVQRSTNLTDWVTILTTNAPSNGLFNDTDDFSDLGVVPASAYYRLQWNP